MSTTERRGRTVTAHDLEHMGKSAARLSETSGLSLTEAAVRTLEPAGLNAEQIRRAVEHCNIHAVNAKFAQLSGDSRIVHIDGGPADPMAVIDALNATQTAPEARILALEYSSGPSTIKRSSISTGLPQSKVDLPRLAERLKAAHDELVAMCEGTEFRMEMKLAELEQQALRAHREGASLNDLTSAWQIVDPRIAGVAAQQLSDRIPWGIKMASQSINPGHPVVGAFAEFAKTAAEFHRASVARTNVEQELAKVTGFLQMQLS